MRTTGRYQILGTREYFIPDPLPPLNPPLTLAIETATLYGETMLELGKLNEMSDRLPDVKRFIKAYVIKEALLSSAIEGIHTTLLDIYTQPLLESKPNKNTQLVLNYTKALSVALEMIQNEGMPITSRVLLAAHKTLMEVGQGDSADPGNYRKQAVRVGNLVPPPAPQVPQLMSELEIYINTNETLPPLIKAGLAHVQFEEIHPFLDGNGRIGRLLIILILIKNGILTTPLLYPSYYFKKHQSEYYHRLDRVRTQGDFEGWITFYLTALKESSIDAHRRAKDIEALKENFTHVLMQELRLSPKMRQTRLQALSNLFSHPVITISELSQQIGISYNTASQIISNFMELGFLVEETQQKRGRLFAFKPYLDLLEHNYQ